MQKLNNYSFNALLDIIRYHPKLNNKILAINLYDNKHSIIYSLIKVFEERYLVNKYYKIFECQIYILKDLLKSNFDWKQRSNILWLLYNTIKKVSSFVFINPKIEVGHSTSRFLIDVE